MIHAPPIAPRLEGRFDGQDVQSSIHRPGALAVAVLAAAGRTCPKVAPG